MPVGQQITSDSVNMGLTNDAVALRNWAERVSNRQKQFGTLAALEAIGYAAPDATSALAFINFMNGIAAVYLGTGTQQSVSNYDAAFAPLWAGQ